MPGESTAKGSNDLLEVDPPLLIFNYLEPGLQQSLLVSVIDGGGLNVKGAAVELAIIAELEHTTPWDAFVIGLAPIGKRIAWQPASDGKSASIMVKTGFDGTAGLLLYLDPVKVGQLPPNATVDMVISAEIDGQPQEVSVQLKVAGL